MGFIDIHSHIVPGVDDGAHSREESLEMLRVAIEAGTTDLVATPHANPRYSYDRDASQTALDDLQSAVGGAIQLHLGCDCHFSHDNLAAVMAAPARFTVNGGPWLLVEFSDYSIPPATEVVFASLRALGVYPIVTHPERNLQLLRNSGRLKDWVRAGAYLQVTAQSLTGGFGGDARGLSLDLIRHGLVHFVASDAHDPVGRPPRLDEAFRLLCSKFGEEYARLLVEEYPRAVIEGRAIEAGPAPLPPARRWYQFWR
jgi:protein-tyrosine phosphatase